MKLTTKIDENDLYKPEDGFGVETDPHVTVKYGLHENDHDKVFTTLGKISPVTVKFKTKVSLFENEKYDVIKINLSGPDIRALNKRVSDIFECTDGYPVYTPHSTIAYVKPGTGHKYLNLDSDFMGSEFDLTRLIYSDSKSDKKYKYLK